MTSTAAAALLVPTRRVPIVGIVGGIGSGKSAVARWVAEHANVSVLDADQMGHNALQAPEVKQALCHRFGDAILGTNGAIARSALAREVFGPDPRHSEARRDLEVIVHPAIDLQIAQGVQQATKLNRDAVLLDAAVLLEAGWRNKCDLVVFIDTPDDVRLKRVLQDRGWTESELHRRESSQWSLTEKRREADLIVSNDGDLETAGQRLLAQLRDRGVNISETPGNSST